MRTVYTDVLTIGTGFGAAAPALRLAESGARVVMVEKGPMIRTADFRQTSDPKYLLKYIKTTPGDHLTLTHAEALGGGSGFYEMVSLRAPSVVFRQVDTDGRPLWPTGINRAALDPYYDVAERMLHVSQISPEEVPKSGLAFSQLMVNLGYSVDRARYAVRGCQGSGFCVSGCIYGAKQSLFLNYLPQAVAAGAEIETDLEALIIEPLSGAHAPRGQSLASCPYRYRVVCRGRTGEHQRVGVVTRILVLGGGTVGTTKLLLRSRATLPLLSEHVGRNIAYNGSVKVAGLLPDCFPDADMFTGRTHPGMISYEFLESHGITVHGVKAQPLMIVSAARLHLEGDSREPGWWGRPNVELMQQLRRRIIVLAAFGLTPPGAVLEAPDGGDPTVSLPITADLEHYHEQTHGLLQSILLRNGCRLVETKFLDNDFMPEKGIHFSTAHQVGACRMADTKAAGVADGNGEVFDYPGIYVSDGSSIPSSLSVNTSLTILANAERVAAGIQDRYSLRAAA